MTDVQWPSLCRSWAIQAYFLTKAGHTVGRGLGGGEMRTVLRGTFAERVCKMHVKGSVCL